MQQRLQIVKLYFENNSPLNNVKINAWTTIINGKDFLLVNYARFKETGEELYLEQMEQFMNEVIKTKNNA